MGLSIIVCISMSEGARPIMVHYTRFGKIYTIFGDDSSDF